MATRPLLQKQIDDELNDARSMLPGNSPKRIGHLIRAVDALKQWVAEIAAEPGTIALAEALERRDAELSLMRLENETARG